MAHKDKYFHVFWELLAVLFIAPFSIYLVLNYNNCFNLFDKFMIWVIILGTFIVDGYLNF